MRYLLAIIYFTLCAALPVAFAMDEVASKVMNMEIDASKKAVTGDIQGAIAIYSDVLQLQPTNIDVYLDRGLLYRELGDTSKSMSDAAYALKIIEAWMARGSNSDKIYYQRAMANRLLQKYDLAEQDMRLAIQKSRSNKYQDDLQSILLEAKMKTGG